MNFADEPLMLTRMSPNNIKTKERKSCFLDVNDVTPFKHKEIDYINILSRWINESPFCG